MAEMDKERLREFIYRICRDSRDDQTAKLRITQLLEILKQQNAGGDLTGIAETAVSDIQELKEHAMQKSGLSDEDLQTAHRRAAARRWQEMEIERTHSRC